MNILEVARQLLESEIRNITDELEKKHSGLKLDVMAHKDKLNLSRIVVPKENRSSGIGTSVMNTLKNHADSTGKTITLSPSSSFGGSVTRLKKFYKSHGFVENKGKNKDFTISDSMYRNPQ